MGVVVGSVGGVGADSLALPGLRISVIKGGNVGSEVVRLADGHAHLPVDVAVVKHGSSWANCHKFSRHSVCEQRGRDRQAVGRIARAHSVAWSILVSV
jgi:hypothetical protein